MTESTSTAGRPDHRRLVLKLLLVVALAFAFGFALVPLYDAFCAATGLNGKTDGPDKVTLGGLQAAAVTTVAPSSRIDATRTITVEFMSTSMPGLPWDIKPLTPSLDLHPGEVHQVLFRVHNRSDQPIVGQAIPSVTPGTAALAFHKLDCFCFSQQTLAPGETKDLPVTFIVKPEIDKDVRTITLAYALFNVDEAQAKTLSASR
ncbi:MAG: cytochrome c oxidase assembly protein [Propionivibrio sp.]